MAGECYGHGGHGVLHNGQDLDVGEVEGAPLGEPVEHLRERVKLPRHVGHHLVLLGGLVVVGTHLREESGSL